MSSDDLWYHYDTSRRQWEDWLDEDDADWLRIRREAKVTRDVILRAIAKAGIGTGTPLEAALKEEADAAGVVLTAEMIEGAKNVIATEKKRARMEAFCRRTIDTIGRKTSWAGVVAGFV